jgi:hypothetical protein
MPYYPDLSSRRRDRKKLNIGWLNWHYAFETGRPPKWLVRKLWLYCKYSVHHARGWHDCNLDDCSGPCKKLLIHDKAAQLLKLEEEIARAKKGFRIGGKIRKAPDSYLERLEDNLRTVHRGYSQISHGLHPDTGERTSLGQAEIYVFGEEGRVYVAPTLIFHYVTVHHYKPPIEFVQALKKGPAPPGREYVARLNAAGVPLCFLQFHDGWREEIKRRKAAQSLKSV